MNETIVSGRFYPDFYPSFPDEPLRDRFQIVTTDNEGEGIISLASFRKDETVFRFAGIMLDDITLYTLQLRTGRHLHDPFFMGKVLHSCEPNMICDIDARAFYAVRDIKPGEFLTMDYETTEDVLYRPFECHCGSESCKKYIVGRQVRMNSIHNSIGEVTAESQLLKVP